MCESIIPYNESTSCSSCVKNVDGKWCTTTQTCFYVPPNGDCYLCNKFISSSSGCSDPAAAAVVGIVITVLCCICCIGSIAAFCFGVCRAAGAKLHPQPYNPNEVHPAFPVQAAIQYPAPNRTSQSNVVMVDQSYVTVGGNSEMNSVPAVSAKNVGVVLGPGSQSQYSYAPVAQSTTLGTFAQPNMSGQSSAYQAYPAQPFGTSSYQPQTFTPTQAYQVQSYLAQPAQSSSSYTAQPFSTLSQSAVQTTNIYQAQPYSNHQEYSRPPLSS
jgi:hypothetical protein